MLKLNEDEYNINLTKIVLKMRVKNMEKLMNLIKLIFV